MRDIRLPDFPVVVPFEVWFRDLDAMGHVNNAVYFSYFEQARTKYWLTLLDETDVKKIGFIVVHAACDYREPAQLGERLLAGCRIAAIGRTSFSFEYRIVSGDKTDDTEARVLATGKTIQALYDWDRKQTVLVSSDLQKKIEEREGHPPKTLTRSGVSRILVPST